MVVDERGRLRRGWKKGREKSFLLMSMLRTDLSQSHKEHAFSLTRQSFYVTW